MVWIIEFDIAAEQDLKKLPKSEQKKLLKAIHRIANLPTPRSAGKPLKSQFGACGDIEWAIIESFVK